MADISVIKLPNGNSYNLKDTTARSTANSAVPNTRTVNGKALSSDISLGAGDVGAYTKKETDTKINAAVASTYKYKGSVTADKLPTSGQVVGDVYNITNDSSYGKAGMNVAWNGTTWDALGSNVDLSNYVTTSDSRLSNARPASDVYAWAKAAKKPSYSASEINGLGSLATKNGLSAGDVGALPTSGGTMTGDIAFAATGTTGTSNKISFSGSTDGAQIYYNVPSSDQGNLIFNMTDDTNAYIQFAQNGTVHSYISPAEFNYMFHNNSLRVIVFRGNALKINNARLREERVIYYPDDNPTWTEEIKEYYRGSYMTVPIRLRGIIEEVIVQDVTCWDYDGARIWSDRIEDYWIRYPEAYDGASAYPKYLTVKAGGVKYEGTLDEVCQQLFDVYDYWFEYRVLETQSETNQWTIGTNQGRFVLGDKYCNYNVIVSSPMITLQPKTTEGFVGDRISFKVKATGTDLNYQWQYSNDGGSTWKNSGAVGADTASLRLDVKASFNQLQYRCQITAPDGRELFSNPATLTVKSRITSQPAGRSAKVGATVTFTVKTAGPGLKYQWQLKKPGTDTWTNSGAKGSKTSSLSIGVLGGYNKLQYRCVITDANGKKLTSNPATLTVTPVLKTNPVKAVSAKVGDKVTLSVNATGAGLKKQWQYSSDGKTWKNSGAEGSKSANLVLKVSTGFNKLQYRCVITDANGQKLTSTAATLTVGPELKSHPADKTAKVGETAKFTAKATGASLKYQWYYSNDGGKTWKKSQAVGSRQETLNIDVKKGYDGLLYRCVITDANGNTMTTNGAKLTVK